MTAVLLDTHAWVWTLWGDPRLSEAALAAIAGADAVWLSPISFCEIAQKVRVGKWPEMEEWLAELPELLRRQGGLAAPLSPRMAILAGGMDWAHRDPFDRIIAATALEMKLPLISAGSRFDGIVERVW
ncbi:MAG: twitching motility protein PilT [Rhodothalassiaceae bacterium]|nr:MAG: twitching motility protein PilT [Rhodothalassiaceae bacterium]